MWSDVLDFLQAARFVDILLPGSVDRSGPFPVWRPLTLPFGVYLQAESGLVQFTSVNGNGGLRIRLAGRIGYGGDLGNDPDEDLVAASVGDQYLAAPGVLRPLLGRRHPARRRQQPRPLAGRAPLTPAPGALRPAQRDHVAARPIAAAGA